MVGIIPRTMQPEVMEVASEYPVVAIRGPRQAGKTTLAKRCFPDYGYVSLEDPDVRRVAIEDPRGFFKSYPRPLILDEIQRVPQLLSYIQTLVDDPPERFFHYHRQQPPA